MMADSTRHTDAALGAAALTDFLAGQRVRVRSGHIDAAQWSAGRLILTFDTGVRYAYPCSPAQARAFALAPSKGGALWDMYLSKNERGTKL